MKSKNNFYRNVILFIFIILFSLIFYFQYAKSDEADKLPVVIQELVKPPFVPTHNIVAKGGPKVIKVRMRIDEKIVEIDEQGTKFRVFAFNDSIPGPLIVAHVGDYIELTLVNPKKNNFEHNVDSHAARGA